MSENLLNEIVDWIVDCAGEDICQICAYYNDENNKKFFETYNDDELNEAYCFYHGQRKKIACREGIIEYFKKIQLEKENGNG